MAPLVNCTKDNINTEVVLVVDTNIFIHELDIIKDVLNSNIKGIRFPIKKDKNPFFPLSINS